MQDNYNQDKDEVLNKLNRILFDHYFSLSTIAASKGEFNLAGEYISDLLKSNGEIPILLDLQAKIYAQQGKFNEAEFLWKKCIVAEPDNNHFVSALNRIHKLQQFKVFKHLTIYKIFGAIAVILLFSLVLGLWFPRIDRNSENELMQKQQTVILGRLDSVLNMNKNISEDDLVLEISDKLEKITGITIDRNNNGLIISFNSGLFNTGIKIKPNQEPIVLQLAKEIEAYAGKVTVFILGCTDNLPIIGGQPFESNNALRIARAGLIYDLFYENSRIPGEDLIIGSISEANSPFSNDSPENQLKNRTVLIKLIQKE